MKREGRKLFCVAVCMLAAFFVWTAAVCTFDVKAIGPNGSSVGFSALNGMFHELTGVHMELYELTDMLSIIPLGLAAAFAALGLWQLIKRRHIARVDGSILLLGGFYAVVVAVFVLFELLAVNYRPILIEGALEASYPSSTTMLVMCIMPTAMMQLNSRIKRRDIRIAVSVFIVAFTVSMVLARLVSGVHWLTDIVAGALLSSGLVLLYAYLSAFKLNDK